DVSAFSRLLTVRRFSPNTVRAYAYDLQKLMLFLDERGLAVQDFTPARAADFLATLRHTPSNRRAQRLDLAATVDGGRLQTELDRIAKARAKTRNSKSRTAKRNAEAAHTKAECALRDHPALGRWLRQQATARLVIDRATANAQPRLDGKYLIATSDPHISAEDAALGYKNLLEAERGFRDLKSNLLLRPVFHRLEHRIRAHVLICGSPEIVEAFLCRFRLGFGF